MIVKRIVGWEADDDPYTSQPAALYPITEKVDWWDEARLTGRKDFLNFVWGNNSEEVHQDDGWSRLTNHEGCREWVRGQAWMAEGNAEQLMRLIDESEKDDQIVFRASW